MKILHEIYRSPIQVSWKILLGCVASLFILKISQVIVLSSCPTPKWESTEGRLYSSDFPTTKTTIDYTLYTGIQKIFAGILERIDDLSLYNTLGAIICCLMFLAAKRKLESRNIKIPEFQFKAKAIVCALILVAIAFYIGQVYSTRSDINGTFFAKTNLVSVRIIQFLEGLVNVTTIVFAYMPLLLGFGIRRSVQDAIDQKRFNELALIPELISIGVLAPIIIVFSVRIFFTDKIRLIQDLDIQSASTVADNPGTVFVLTLLWYLPYVILCCAILKDILPVARLTIEFKMPPIVIEPREEIEQDGANQLATAPDSKPEGESKPNSESDVRPK
ncbi:MAG: hypothetical protein AAGH88_00275 [Planctomycetota bacterium]